MSHLLSDRDRTFQRQVETCEYPLADFNHRAHLVLAYVYLAENDTDTAYELMRDALRRFLQHSGIDTAKYHDTITRAWILAVRHFMEGTANASSADDFIGQNPMMLDSKIMLSHYSAELLFSEEARRKFVEPDRDPIPRYGD